MSRSEILEAWDGPQLDPLSDPPEGLSELELDDAVELIEQWFLHNFEDPGVQTPYDGREGGYQYVWGGPYYTRDVIENIFADSGRNY